MKKSLVGLSCVLCAATFLLLAAVPSPAAIVATDNADNGAYTDGWDLTDNDGLGYTAWGQDAGGGTLGRFVETGGGQVDGSRSFALYNDSNDAGDIAVARPLSATLTMATFEITMRHGVDNATGFTGANLKDSSSAPFGTGELLSFGLTPGTGNDSIAVTDSTGIHDLLTPDGELRGDIIKYTVVFDTGTDAYSLIVSNLSSGLQLATFSGTMVAGGPVAAFGVGHFNDGGTQNLYFDSPTFTVLDVVAVPEPSVVVLLLSGGGLLWMRWRRSRR